MRATVLLLAGVLWAALACGCGGGDGDKKGLNKDRDRPLRQDERGERGKAKAP